MNFPIKKSLFICGVKVELSQTNESAPINFKVFTQNDELGINIVKYLYAENLISPEFLYQKEIENDFENLSPS